MKVLSVAVSRFKRRMEKKLRESKEREVPKSFFVHCTWFWGHLKMSDIRQAYEFELYGRRGVLPQKILVEYLQNCDILD